MKTGKKTFRSSVLKYATLAVIGISFVTYTVATTSAASVSFVDSVKAFIGIESNIGSVSESAIDRGGSANRTTVSTTLVISQFYGGGGATSGTPTYLNDYVEIKNVSSSPQSLNTLSLMYGSATGNFASSATNAFVLPDVTLAPGQYYFVQLGSVGTVGGPFPVTPDATTTNMNLSAANGKVALATAAFPAATCGATATPCDASQLALLVDWAAYGTGGNGPAGIGEGGNPSVNNGVSLTNTMGGVRKLNGCQDTDNNNNDFDVVTAPVPRNMATPAAPCSGGPTATPTSTTPPISATPTNTATNTPTNTATVAATATASPSPVQGGTLVISQFYGGGGATSGTPTYLNDYIEIKNISSSPQSLNTLSLMYGSAAGNFASSATNAFALPDVTLAPGQYYLVQLGSVGTVGGPLPVTPDATTTNLNLSATNGKVALATAAFPANTCGGTATPCDASQLALLVDWAAYGTGGNGPAGTGEGGNPSVNNGVSLINTQGGVRKLTGCQDTNNNNNDFDVVTDPVPRNTATAAAPCSGISTPTASPSPTSTTPPTSATPTNTATTAGSATPTHSATATATASPSPVQGATFVISQFDGGGGGSTGTYLNDYVELKNISSASRSLNGLSLYYGAALGNFASTATNAFVLPDVSLAPGQFYLVQLGNPGSAGVPLPVPPDATTTNLNLAAGSGKVALVTSGLGINECGATATPCNATQLSFIVDWAAYGAAGNGAVNVGEGGNPSVNNGVAITSSQGGVRKQNGCQDTNNNNNDFDVVTAPVPRNSMSGLSPCVVGPTPTASPSPTNTFTPTNTATATATPTAAAVLSISQFDGGGGGSAGTYQYDYVELKNVSGTSQSLNGLSLYYGTAVGNFASTATDAFALPNVALAPGQYYLVQLGNVGTAGAALPVAPDATTTNLSMSGTSGKIALVAAGLGINECGGAANPPTTTPCTASQLAHIIDWAAYGAAGNGTPGNGEGGTSVNNGIPLVQTQGGVRKMNGCQDTNNNNNDFDVVTAPVPRNSHTAAASCVAIATPTNTSTATATRTNTPTPTATVSFPTPTFTATSTPAPACIPNTISWWPGENNAVDIVGGNNGTLQNGATFATGEVGQAFSFDGVDDDVFIGNPASLNLTSAITVEAWIKTNSFPDGTLANVVAKWGFDATVDSYLLGLIKTSGVIHVIGGIGDGATGDPGIVGGTVSTNTWTHVAMTYDSTSGSNLLYLNGAQVASRTRNGGIFPTVTNVYIGREDSGQGRFFNGLIDEPTIYSRALSAQEILAIFNAGSAGKCMSASTPTATATNTATNTPTHTATNTPTRTSTNTPTPTVTATATATASPTPITFANSAAICTTLGAPADLYPSTITVAGGPNEIDGIRVTLFNVVHQFPDNMDFLLVGPNGAKFILMADAGGALAVPTPGVTLTFTDGAGQVVPDSGPLTSGTYEPTSWEPGQASFPTPAPAAPYNEPGSVVGGTGTQTLGGNFRLSNANGVWRLYMRDDDGMLTNPGAITGCVNGGWQLQFMPTTAAGLSVSGRVTTAEGNGIRNAKVVLTGNSLDHPLIATTGSFGYYTFEGLTAGETYVLTVNSKRYTFSVPSRVISLVDNVVDADFVADPQE